jgi:hypothetical protein
MLYVARTTRKFEGSRLWAAFLAIICAVSVTGAALCAPAPLSDSKGGGWDWSLGLAEEVAAEGAKVEVRTQKSHSPVEGVALDDHLSQLLSCLTPVLAPVVALISAQVPSLSSLINLGAHSATSPPTRA